MPDLAGITAEKWLKTIGAAIRRYCDRPVESLDIQIYQESGITWGELMVDESSSSDTSTLSKVEIQPDLRNLKQLLTGTLQSLELDLKRIFLLKYGLNLTQTQIGAALKKHQSSISRTQRNFEEILLQQFMERFDAKALNVPSGLGIDPDIFLALRDYLNQYWEDYYAEMMHQFFRESIHALEPQLQDDLRLVYRDLSNANTVQTHDLETRSVLQAQQGLSEGIAIRIQDYGQLALEAQSAIQKRLKEMITQWLLTSA
jgi:PAS domain-containing protein